jgi:hypothetical protein
MHQGHQKDEKETTLYGNAQNHLPILFFDVTVILPDERGHNAVWHSSVMFRV